MHQRHPKHLKKVKQLLNSLAALQRPSTYVNENWVLSRATTSSISFLTAFALVDKAAIILFFWF